MNDLNALIQEANTLNHALTHTGIPIETIYNNIATSDCYNSNAIEGNHATYEETKILLKGEEVVDHLSLNDVNEICDYQTARIAVNALYINDYKILTLEMIQQIHSNVLDSNYAWGGYLRCRAEDKVGISGHPEIKLVEPQQVLYYLTDAIDSYNENIASISDGSIKLSPLEIIAEFAEAFIQVHPFLDGNGRTSRLLINLLLMINGYRPIVIPVTRRDDYIKALDTDIVSNDTFATQFKEFLLEVMIENYKKYLSNTKNSEIKSFGWEV